MPVRFIVVLNDIVPLIKLMNELLFIEDLVRLNSNIGIMHSYNLQ